MLLVPAAQYGAVGHPLLDGDAEPGLVGYQPGGEKIITGQLIALIILWFYLPYRVNIKFTA